MTGHDAGFVSDARVKRLHSTRAQLGAHSPLYSLCSAVYSALTDAAFNTLEEVVYSTHEWTRMGLTILADHRKNRSAAEVLSRSDVSWELLRRTIPEALQRWEISWS